jgi:hypothetical protein
MSHMAAIDLEIRDLDALKEACQHLGLTLVLGQTTWKWWGSWVNDFHAKEAAFHFGIKPDEYGRCADHVLKVVGDEGAYEVGVVRRRDGKPGWILVYDFYGSAGEKVTKLLQGVDEKGQFDRAGKLKQYYAACVAAKVQRQKGFDCRIIQKENNHVQCIARRLKG